MNRAFRFSDHRLAARAALFVIALAGSACSDLPEIVIATPLHGEFTQAANIDVTGMVTEMDPANAAVTVNGVSVVVSPGGVFSTNIAIDTGIVFNPIDVVAVDTSNGYRTVTRVVVIAGDSIGDGAYSPQSVALRINDSGLDQLEGSVADLVDFDPADLVAVDTVVLDECVVFFLGCLGSARVTVANPPPSATGFGISMDSMTDFVAADVLVDDLNMHLDVDGSGLVPSCPLEISADTTDIIGDYSLDPDAIDPTTTDVNQIGGVSVVFGNFQDHLSGLCDVPIIGDIIQLFLPDVQDLFTDGFTEFLNDPDGAGPEDAVIADALEVALAGIEIAGPIGESLGVMLDTPIFDIPEDDDGVTIGSDTRVTAQIGTGPGECDAPPDAPDLLASFHVPETFPTFGATTASGNPFDMGICLSTSAFNQLLKAQIECGLLQLEITEFDFGFGLVPLTVGAMSLFIPELAAFPASAPLLLKLRPTLAPLLTGNAGPGGELGELRMGQLLIELRDATPGVEQPLLVAAVDFAAGFELLVDPATGQLAPTVSSLDPGDVTVAILDNLVQTDEATLQAVLPLLLAQALPSLGASLGSFPIPTFLDLELDPVEVSKSGQFMSIFANLAVPLLSNGGMENTLDLPSDGLDWEGDLFAVVSAENGIEPQAGAAMLRFDGTEPTGAGAGPDAEVFQQVDLSAFAAQIASGQAVFQATAFFNRIDAGPNTDTQFEVAIDALDGGGGVLASIDQTLSTDADPASWELELTPLLLPVGTASARVYLIATEDILDDASAPEFDGHYVDHARATVLAPLSVQNADMEDTGDVFDDGTGWETDAFSIVAAENGITPLGGGSMLRFDATMGAVAGSDPSAIASQNIALGNYRGLVSAGGATLHVSASFNRVAGDANTDTQFTIIVQAFNAGGAAVDGVLTLFYSDADPGSWESHAASLVLPATTTNINLVLAAVENVSNDVVSPEFDGHYADEVSVWIEP